MTDIMHGHRVRDIVTGFEGIATGRLEYINGCVQWSLAPRVGEDGKPVDSQWFDVDRLEYVDDGVRETVVPGAGSRSAEVTENGGTVGGPASNAPVQLTP